MMDGGTLAYGPVSTLAECLQHIAGCTECKGRWPAVPGMLAMTRRPDGHVDFEVSAAGGAGAGAGPGPGLRLLQDSREESQDSREEPAIQRTEFYKLVYDRRDHFWELRRLSGLRLDRGSELGGVCEALEDQIIDDLDFDPFTDEVEIGLIAMVRRRV